MNKRLAIQQLDKRFSKLPDAALADPPFGGWVRAIRTALGMTQEQLAARMQVKKQRIQRIEEQEQEGTLKVDTLRRVANALDMQLYYGLIPKDGSLEQMIQRRAHELAREIVARSSQTMALEDQANSRERIEQAIDERTEKIVKDLPQALWD